MNAMTLNADLRQRVVQDSAQLAWSDSPLAGVRRRMLEREGGEVARATSVVQYAPGARFDLHPHAFGEEILVLEGVLEDESGTYETGTYVRNPPGSSHAPSSQTGCTLFVKLRHLDPTDQIRVVIQTRQALWYPGTARGLSVMPLAGHGTENTALVRWAPGTRFTRHRHFGGEEIFVIDGVFEDEHGRYPAGTWIRSPHLSEHQPFSEEGCTILVKTGHLDVGATPGTPFAPTA